MGYRSDYLEIDYSGFVSNTLEETGAMVLKSSKGPDEPVKCQSEQDVLTYFGTPSATNPSVFEAIAFVKKAPLWAVSAVGSGALFGGVDVGANTVSAFGTGRDLDTYSYGSNPNTSHSFFARSPYADDLATDIQWVSGEKYTMTLYKVVSTGNQYLAEYSYSLLREKDAFGASLYIFDVFDDDPYVIPKVNSSYAGSYGAIVSGTILAFTGGTRGSDPLTSHYTLAWQNFQKANKYPAKIFMDVVGNSQTTMNSVIQTYQPYAQGISVIPMGNDSDEAVVFRSGLGLDTDDVALYTNWSRIEDPYNNSSAWVSLIGSVGKKYAMMKDSFDAASPAGIDENNHGGQLNDWRVLEIENDYSDAELQDLDEAQINPIIFDEYYGTMVYGDKTLQATNSDTSFVGTRRLYKFMIETIVKQVLRLQEFKLNDSIHRLKAKTMVDDFMAPIKAGGWIREFKTVCDETNNTDVVLQQRKFIVDLYVKVGVNTQFAQLRLTRLSQTQTIASFVA